MAKKTNPPKKKTSSPVGPYKPAPKNDKSTGVRNMTAPKPKGGSQFLPKGIPAGSTKNAPKKQNSNQNPGNGTYISGSNGRLGRTNGLYGPLESIDTTGYGSGKKQKFEVMKSYSDGVVSRDTISRKEVPSKINELKKGATRELQLKNGVIIKDVTKKK